MKHLVAMMLSILHRVAVNGVRFGNNAIILKPFLVEM